MFPRLRPEETMLTGFCGRVKAIKRLIYTLRFVGRRQIGERIGVCEWRTEARATAIRQVGRFRKICDRFTGVSRVGPDFKNENAT